jgi:hypothetical protein
MKEGTLGQDAAMTDREPLKRFDHDGRKRQIAAHRPAEDT